jgi:1-acyl-sn-glycerol-3-phosphate acyltransferase
MSKNQKGAQPPLEFIPPAFNPLVLGIVRPILPLWLKLKTNITDIEGVNIERLAGLYQQFQARKIRLLMAFRHPNVQDPLCLGYLAWHLLGKSARQRGIELNYPLHAHFIYDRGIPLWAGSGVGWLYSQLGGTPIQRGKLDVKGLKSARNLLVNGDFPLAAAPEGATNGHNEIVSPLEPGIAQFGFWAVEDLNKAGRGEEEVIILPIGVQYYYLTPPWQSVAQLLAELEKDSGLSVSNNGGLEAEKLYQRLYALGEHLLSVMENFYRDFYHRSLPVVSEVDANTVLSNRLQNLLNVALTVAEEYFNIPAKGNVIDRCRRLEQAGWDYIYREEFKTTNNLSAVERGLGDRLAEEANLRMWHMRIVESFVAVTGYYVKEKPSVERFAETTLLLWDLVTRLKGGNPFFRPELGKQRVKITIGEGISVSDRFSDYKGDRRLAVANLTQDIQTSLTNMIDT